MRLEGQTPARTWTQFESNLPAGKIEPVSVEVKENDTKVEGMAVFESLVKMSWIDRTPDQVVEDLNLEKMTNQDWEVKFWDWNHNNLLDRFWLSRKFLFNNYQGRWAYIKVGEKEIYGQVNVDDRRVKMKTPEWILTMPSITVSDQFSGENKSVFFPVSALLTESEQALFELYRHVNVNEDVAQLEMQIMRLLEQLAVANGKNATISETNTQLADIETMCKNCGTIKKLCVEDWKLVLEFDWRIAMDSDGNTNWMVLPPVKILIDLRSFTVRWNRTFHPHVMSDYTLCMGGRLTELVQDCITKRDLKTLVGGMIEFWNSRTSSDAGESDRHPAGCIVRYNRDMWPIDWTNLPVSIDDIKRTMENRWRGIEELGPDFVDLFHNEE